MNKLLEERLALLGWHYTASSMTSLRTHLTIMYHILIFSTRLFYGSGKIEKLAYQQNVFSARSFLIQRRFTTLILVFSQVSVSSV